MKNLDQSSWIKLIAGSGLFGMYFALVFMHLASADGLVLTIVAALTALGIIHSNNTSSEGTK